MSDTDQDYEVETVPVLVAQPAQVPDHLLAAAQNVTANDIVAASTEARAPADPLAAEIAALHQRVTMLEKRLFDHSSMIERARNFFDGHLNGKV